MYAVPGGITPAAVIVWGEAGAFAQQIATGPHRLTGDEPGSVGGTDTGPFPLRLVHEPELLCLPRHRSALGRFPCRIFGVVLLPLVPTISIADPDEERTVLGIVGPPPDSQGGIAPPLRRLCAGNKWLK